jgi:hypothetical protein
MVNVIRATPCLAYICTHFEPIFVVILGWMVFGGDTELPAAGGLPVD